MMASKKKPAPAPASPLSSDDVDSGTLSSSNSSTTSPSPPEFRYELRVPRDRVGVLVGKKGFIKRQIETETSTALHIDSKEGEVAIISDDGLNIFVAREIVRAIARGFNPELALLLLKPEYHLEVISLADNSRNKKDQIRLKGRIIGEEGKSRRVIEDLTGTSLCAYGKTVSILGETGPVSTARRAVHMLLLGSPHRNVYKWLERQKKTAHRKELFTK